MYVNGRCSQHMGPMGFSMTSEELFHVDVLVVLAPHSFLAARPPAPPGPLRSFGRTTPGRQRARAAAWSRRRIKVALSSPPLTGPPRASREPEPGSPRVERGGKRRSGFWERRGEQDMFKDLKR